VGDGLVGVVGGVIAKYENNNLGTINSILYKPYRLIYYRVVCCQSIYSYGATPSILTAQPPNSRAPLGGATPVKIDGVLSQITPNLSISPPSILTYGILLRRNPLYHYGATPSILTAQPPNSMAPLGGATPTIPNRPGQQ
jgi:hypothetical protein